MVGIRASCVEMAKASKKLLGSSTQPYEFLAGATEPFELCSEREVGISTRSSQFQGNLNLGREMREVEK